MLVSSRWLALAGLVACLLVLVTVSAVQANGAHQEVDADAAIETETTQWAMLVDRLDSDTFDEYDAFFESESEVDVDVDVETDADADADSTDGVSDELLTTPKKATTTVKKAAATKSTVKSTKLAAKSTTTAVKSTKSAAQRTTPTEQAAKWAAFLKANPKKKYKNEAAKQAAFAVFSANRVKLAEANDRAANQLNPKPFKSSGPLTDIPVATFRAKYLKSRRPGTTEAAKTPVRASAETKAAVKRFGKIAPNTANTKRKVATTTKKTTTKATTTAKTAAVKTTAAKKTTTTKAVRFSQLQQTPTGAGGTAGAAGAKGGAAGAKGGAAGAKGGAAGAKGGAAGAKGGAAGAKGGAAGAKGGAAGAKGGAAGAKGGNTVIVAPTSLDADTFEPFTGPVFLNPADKTDEERMCRTVASIWFRRYAYTKVQKIWQFGLKFFGGGSTQFTTNPMKFCTEDWAQWAEKFHQEQGYLRNAFDELKSHPANTPFINNIIAKADDEPRDQEQCGSCWSTAAIGSYEAALKKSGALQAHQILSTQQILDCVKTKNSDGCSGGTPQDALAWLTKNSPALESEYPYTGIQGTCRTIANSAVAKVPKSKGWTLACPSCTKGACADQFKYETELLFDVKSEGPFVAYVDASSWQGYGGGIFPHSMCNSDAESGNHVVQLMGYGQEKGVPYWIIKNSWGTEWGENGMIRLAMGVNACGIANFVGGATI